MNLRDRLQAALGRGREATTAPQLAGSPVVVGGSLPTGYVERNITPATLADYLTLHPIISALSGISQLAFCGFDFAPRPLDEGDDTQQKKIDQILPVIKRIDRRIGQIGKVRQLGTLGLVRGSFLQGAAFRQAIGEKSYTWDGKWQVFDEIQLLPGESFASAPTEGGSTTSKSDPILPGVVYDVPSRSTRFFQSQGMGRTLELDPEAVVYISDPTTVEATSLLKSIASTAEQWKTIRGYGMLAARRVSVPNEIAQVDGKVIAELSQAGATISPADVQAYAEELIKRQGYDVAKLSIAGMKLEYPRVTMALDPWDIDERLKTEILDFWFHKDILKSVAQAISVSSAPEKDLLDRHIATEREIYGKPWEGVWSEFFEVNGYDLTMEFDWWSWAPADQKAEAENARADLASGLATIDETRARRGYPALDKKTRDRLYEERRALRGVPAGIGLE